MITFPDPPSVSFNSKYYMKWNTEQSSKCSRKKQKPPQPKNKGTSSLSTCGIKDKSNAKKV